MYLANSNAFKELNVAQPEFICRVIINTIKQVNTISKAVKNSKQTHYFYNSSKMEQLPSTSTLPLS